MFRVLIILILMFDFARAQTCANDEDTYDMCIECCIRLSDLSSKQELEKVASTSFNQFCESLKKPIPTPPKLPAGTEIAIESEANKSLASAQRKRLIDYCSTLKKSDQKFTMEAFDDCPENCKKHWPSDD